MEEIRNKIPHHLAIIPDGNRRWARERGLPTLEGHRKGFDAFKDISRTARDLGIHTLTIWGFSTENWKRDKKEVDYLMDLFEKIIGDFSGELIEDEVRFVHLGRKDRLPKSLVTKISALEEKTKSFSKHVFNVALDYGGQDEILRASEKLKAANLEVTSENLDQFLDTTDQPHPNPDLIIRTSGEMRTSGLMIWQAAYAEFYSEPDHFPDFNKEKLVRALEEYSRRERRFGGN